MVNSNLKHSEEEDKTNLGQLYCVTHCRQKHCIIFTMDVTHTYTLISPPPSLIATSLSLFPATHTICAFSFFVFVHTHTHTHTHAFMPPKLCLPELKSFIRQDIIYCCYLLKNYYNHKISS